MSNKLSLKGQILIAFGITISVLVLVVGVSYINLREIRQRTDDWRQATETLARISNLNQNIGLVHASFLRHMLEEDTLVRERHLQVMQQVYVKNSTLLEQIQTGILTPGEQHLYERILEAREKYQSSREQAIRISRSLGTSSAYEFSSSKVRPAYEEYVKVIVELADSVAAFAEEKAIYSDDLVGATQQTSNLLALVGVIIGGMVTLLLIRVTRQLKADNERLTNEVAERQRAQEEREKLIVQLSESNAELSALKQVTENAISTLDLERLLKLLLTRLVAIMKADAGVISLREDDILRVASSVGLEEEVRARFSIPVGKGFAGTIAATGRYLYVADAQSNSRVMSPYIKARGIRTMLGVPMKRSGNLIGVVHVDWLKVRPEDPREVRLLEITAERCVMAILNAQLYQQARDLREKLEHRVQERTGQLAAANKELEAFAYSVSHDLRAPLRHIDGFIDLLNKEISDSANEKTKRFLSVISDSAKKMGELIDNLLSFSRMGRAEMQNMRVDVHSLVRSIIKDVEREVVDRQVVFEIGDLPEVDGDSAMLRQVFVNLISNAVKFTATISRAQIRISSSDGDQGDVVFCVKDNGVGFDMRYRDKLFGVFQRLHHSDEFEGTGIGLANVRRIIHRHGGKTWAEGTPGGGASFYFSLPRKTDVNNRTEN